MDLVSATGKSRKSASDMGSKHPPPLYEQSARTEAELADQTFRFI